MSRFEGRKVARRVFRGSCVWRGTTRWEPRDNWLKRTAGVEHFLKVLDQAHRQHVAFYTFDAAGLRAQSSLAAARRGALFSSTFGSEPYVALKMLADETGGQGRPAPTTCPLYEAGRRGPASLLSVGLHVYQQRAEQLVASDSYG